MDLLFKRYASPFLLLDETLRTGRFSEFVLEIISIVNDEINDKTLWEYYLHRVYDKSFAEFMGESKKPRQPEEPIDFETTINDSYEMINSFVPE